MDLKYYSITETASILGLTTDTLKKYLKDGVLVGHRINTRGDWRISDEAIREFVESR